MAVKKVIEIGHRVLKLKNRKVTNFNSLHLKKLIQDLKDTMKETDLIGIAAPQISENYQVFLTYPRKTRARKLVKGDILRVYINPQIVYFSKEKNLMYEGCGCVPKHSIFGPVIRAKEIAIEAFNQNGKKFSLRCDGILARVIQHEFDHLQGIEFLEEISDYRKVVSWNFYRDTIRNSSAQKTAAKITKIDYRELRYSSNP